MVFAQGLRLPTCPAEHASTVSGIGYDVLLGRNEDHVSRAAGAIGNSIVIHIIRIIHALSANIFELFCPVLAVENLINFFEGDV